MKFQLRRLAVEMGTPCLTSLDTAREVLRVVANRKDDANYNVEALQDLNWSNTMSGYVEQGEVVRNEQIGSDVWIMDIHAPKQGSRSKGRTVL